MGQAVKNAKLVLLRDGPMNAMLVTPDAPALQPGWNGAGRYERKGDIATWVPTEGATEDPIELSAEQRKALLDSLLEELGPLLGNEVDLDLFASGDIKWKVTDGKGQVREYVTPRDVPFPLGLAFTTAHDAYRPALHAAHQAEQAVRDALAAGREDAIEELAQKADGLNLQAITLRRPVVEALVTLLQLRHPETTYESIDYQIGRLALDEWMGALLFRLNQPQIQQSIETPPKARPNRGRRRKA